MLVDSHCHIPLLDKKTPVDTVIADAARLDVRHMLCVAVDRESYPEILSLAATHDCIDASVGIHPNADRSQDMTLEKLQNLAADYHVCAIGETGLDYFRSEEATDWQAERFRIHIRAARSVNKPLIIHCRNADEDVLRILTEEGARDVGGVMHCFVGDWQMARRAMKLNFYISFSGIVTFKNAAEVQAVAKQVPIERLLLETDSPYLTPVPYRGKPNQPAYTRYVAEYIAKLRNVDLEHIADQTTSNFFNLFGRREKGEQKQEN